MKWAPPARFVNEINCDGYIFAAKVFFLVNKNVGVDREANWGTCPKVVATAR